MWKKYISREFLVALALMAVATVALFLMDKVDFVAWSAAVGSFAAIYGIGKTVQKVSRKK